MNLKKAKATLDKVIRKGRVHFYKPFQIAEILRRHRAGELDDLNDLDSYKNISKRGRERTQAWGCFVAGAYNLPRMARLSLAGAR